MARQDLLNEVEQNLGSVPGFIQQMSDISLEQWWTTTRDFWLTDTALPMKTKSFVGIGAAAAQRCRY